MSDLENTGKTIAGIPVYTSIDVPPGTFVIRSNPLLEGDARRVYLPSGTHVDFVHYWNRAISMYSSVGFVTTSPEDMFAIGAAMMQAAAQIKKEEREE